MKWCPALLLLAMFPALGLCAETFKGETAYKATLRRADETYRTNLIAAKKAYLDELQKQLTGATRAGDLTLANKVNVEKESVQGELKQLESAAALDSKRALFVTVKSATYGGQSGSGEKTFLDVRSMLKAVGPNTVDITIDDRLVGGKDVAPGGTKSLVLILTCNSLDVGLRISAPASMEIFKPDTEARK